MVLINMDGPNRDQVLRFMRKKEQIEQEIQEQTAVLESQKIGMTEPLVDTDGYPRNDIDVYKVRHARHRIICLQNDHKAIMKHIEKGIHLLHSKIQHSDAQHENTLQNNTEKMDIGQGVTETSMSGVVQAANNLCLADLKAVVRVNFVSAGSPAENAGIQVDDEILEFGSVNASNFTALSQISDIVNHSVGNQVNVKIRRRAEILNLTLTPNPWPGRGLLGCNIVPV